MYQQFVRQSKCFLLFSDKPLVNTTIVRTSLRIRALECQCWMINDQLIFPLRQRENGQITFRWFIKEAMRNFRWDHLRQIGIFLPLESFCKVQYCPSSVLSGLCLKGGKNIWLIITHYQAHRKLSAIWALLHTMAW